MSTKASPAAVLANTSVAATVPQSRQSKADHQKLASVICSIAFHALVHGRAAADKVVLKVGNHSRVLLQQVTLLALAFEPELHDLRIPPIVLRASQPCIKRRNRWGGR
jgi:hypothetical protein